LDIGYRIKVYSDIRYNVGLYAFQSDIGRSDIRLSPISLITDIGLSAHLCRRGTRPGHGSLWACGYHDIESTSVSSYGESSSSDNHRKRPRHDSLVTRLIAVRDHTGDHHIPKPAGWLLKQSGAGKTWACRSTVPQALEEQPCRLQLYGSCKGALAWSQVSWQLWKRPWVW
jgi:hypothetical protein